MPGKTGLFDDICKFSRCIEGYATTKGTALHTAKCLVQDFIPRKNGGKPNSSCIAFLNTIYVCQNIALSSATSLLFRNQLPGQLCHWYLLEASLGVHGQWHQFPILLCVKVFTASSHLGILITAFIGVLPQGTTCQALLHSFSIVFTPVLATLLPLGLPALSPLHRSHMS
ncbi:hypothetical protein MHYP_G00319910 [Metynnis hypsauchen]